MKSNLLLCWFSWFSATGFSIFIQVGFVANQYPECTNWDDQWPMSFSLLSLSASVSWNWRKGPPLHTFITMLLQLLQPVVDVLEWCLGEIKRYKEHKLIGWRLRIFLSLRQLMYLDSFRLAQIPWTSLTKNGWTGTSLTTVQICLRENWHLVCDVVANHNTHCLEHHYSQKIIFNYQLL